MDPNEKYKKLLDYLASLQSGIVSLSGGLDSYFLLMAASDALGEKVMAVTVSTPYMPKQEIMDAVEIAKEIGVKHKLLELPLMDKIKHNPEDRCYLCKHYLFSVLKEIAKKEGMQFVMDGTNTDDIHDYRPGIRALKELKIVSPFLNQGWAKKDIRNAAKKRGLGNWNKQPGACLLSRMPYGYEITIHELEMIEKAEQYLTGMGFDFVRVRSYGNLARIEVSPEDRKRFFSESVLDEVSSALREIGYLFVTMDLGGYRMGSMNLELSEEIIKGS
ncbi:MAG: ATP-dependent sacrificial sulfur transferase LarE [Smithella sp.]